MTILSAHATLTSWLESIGLLHGWAIATAAVVSACCAIVGTPLVVRRMSLLGDAISHAVLPGLVVAVLLGAQPGGIGVLFGATAAAMVTVWFTRFLCSQAGLWEDASVGVSFTTLFAAGHPAAAAKPGSNATIVASFKPTTMHKTPMIETIPSKSAS